MKIKLQESTWINHIPTNFSTALYKNITDSNFKGIQNCSVEILRKAINFFHPGEDENVIVEIESIIDVFNGLSEDSGWEEYDHALSLMYDFLDSYSIFLDSDTDEPTDEHPTVTEGIEDDVELVPTEGDNIEKRFKEEADKFGLKIQFSQPLLFYRQSAVWYFEKELVATIDCGDYIVSILTNDYLDVDIDDAYRASSVSDLEELGIYTDDQLFDRVTCYENYPSYGFLIENKKTGETISNYDLDIEDESDLDFVLDFDRIVNVILPSIRETDYEIEYSSDKNPSEDAD